MSSFEKEVVHLPSLPQFYVVKGSQNTDSIIGTQMLNYIPLYWCFINMITCKIKSVSFEREILGNAYA